jgi:hypothetical protein
VFAQFAVAQVFRLVVAEQRFDALGQFHAKNQPRMNARNIGVMEYWSNGIFQTLQHSNTLFLHSYLFVSIGV